jgi:hypothetical protein
MQRRNFLAGLAGVLATGIAPAIVVEPMKIWVPPKSKIKGRGLTSSINHIDELPWLDPWNDIDFKTQYRSVFENELLKRQWRKIPMSGVSGAYVGPKLRWQEYRSGRTL